MPSINSMPILRGNKLRRLTNHVAGMLHTSLPCRKTRELEARGVVEAPHPNGKLGIAAGLHQFHALLSCP